jgi:uncharacterized Zn finger protein
METIVFLVQGSAEQPYSVSFSSRESGNLTATCSCPAGLVKQYCKHRLNILMGDVTDIVSGNEERVHTVYGWFAGSDVEAALKEIQRLEEEMEKLKKRLSAAKKDVAKAMAD